MDGLGLTLQGRRWRVAAKEELEGVARASQDSVQACQAMGFSRPLQS